MSPHEPVPLTVAQLFGGRLRFRVPIYQRAYAWGKDEIHALVQDVLDKMDDEAPAYYIGSLVVSGKDADNDADWDVIDGQQRLTTLFVILSVLSSMTAVRPVMSRALAVSAEKELSSTLAFEGRERSTSDLQLLARQGRVELLADEGIKAGRKHVHAKLDGLDSDRVAAFAGYLLERVRIVLAPLPGGTDLNHYFEVMNSRGEQLEKHEIVKARLLGILGDDERARKAFSIVWDSCSDLTDPAGTKFVQARFPSGQRARLFGSEWDWLESFGEVDADAAARFDALADVLVPSPAGADIATTVDPPVPTIGSVLRGQGVPGKAAAGAGADDSTARYGSIIDFPNFLLHVLRLHRGERLPLDDKQLVEQFKHIKTVEDAKGFGFRLLKSRFLFDNFVIKTEHDRDTKDDDSNWVLYRPHLVRSGGLSPRASFPASVADDDRSSLLGRRILMLQAMLQVSFSGRSNKEFLFRILQFLDGLDAAPEPRDFVAQLELFARERYSDAHDGDVDAMNRGTSVPHFTFNYVDYLLWLAAVEGRWRPDWGPQPANAQQYRFRYRHSVEHFFPVWPSNSPPLGKSEVDAFGNLCLLTPSENSQRSNLEPVSKVQEYRRTLGSQSLKFRLMAAITDAGGGWGPGEIERHGRQMLELLEVGPVPRAAASG